MPTSTLDISIKLTDKDICKLQRGMMLIGCFFILIAAVMLQYSFDQWTLVAQATWPKESASTVIAAMATLIIAIGLLVIFNYFNRVVVQEAHQRKAASDAYFAALAASKKPPSEVAFHVFLITRDNFATLRTLFRRAYV